MGAKREKHSMGAKREKHSMGAKHGKHSRAPSAGKHSTSPKHGKTAHERQKQNNITQEPSAEKHSTVSEREERVRFSHYLQFYERLFEKVAKVFK